MIVFALNEFATVGVPVLGAAGVLTLVFLLARRAGKVPRDSGWTWCLTCLLAVLLSIGVAFTTVSFAGCGKFDCITEQQRCAEYTGIKLDAIKAASATPDEAALNPPWDDDLWSYNDLTAISCGKYRR